MESTSDPLGHHDWYSDDYVRGWIERDLQRQRDFDPIMRTLVDLCPSRVLDLGGGYGRLTHAILDARFACEVVLQDFSRPMLRYAASYLNDYADRYRSVETDLRDPDWTRVVGGDFDAVVSAIAIHNLRDRGTIARVYHDILGLLRPGGCLVEIDRLGPDDVADRQRFLLRAGFDSTSVRVEVINAGYAVVHGRRP